MSTSNLAGRTPLHKPAFPHRKRFNCAPGVAPLSERLQMNAELLALMLGQYDRLPKTALRSLLADLLQHASECREIEGALPSMREGAA